MEFKQGSLAAQIVNGPFPPDTVRSFLQQVLSALEPMHRGGTAHGAIRPANLLVGAGGKVRLGNSADADTGTDTVAVARPRQTASAKYFAPEQLKTDFGTVGPPA